MKEFKAILEDNGFISSTSVFAEDAEEAFKELHYNDPSANIV